MSTALAVNNYEPAEIRTKPQKVTILYSRLSREDEAAGDSLSIQNQRIFSEEYAGRNGFTPFIHIVDDGWSGTRWDRPGWQELIAKVEADEVGSILTKDSSRIARDYLRMGLYREMFSDKGVRLICINDGYDSFKGDDDFMPFRDIFSEWHARDTSKKIRAIFKSNMANGKRCSGAIPYGYKKNNGDVNDLLIDDDAAAIVRRIYQMIIDGKGINIIARTLMEEKIPIPSEYWKRKGMEYRCNRYTDPYGWTGTTISYIIKNPEYKGTLILGKTKNSSYKGNKKKLHTTPEEQFIFENAIPAIVSEEVWENAQRLRQTRRKAPKIEHEPNPLTGLLWCATCGAKMTHRHTRSSKGHLDNSYICSRYRGITKLCTMHYISVINIEKLILEVIKKVSIYAKTNEEEFINKVREVSQMQQDNVIKECKKSLSKSNKRHDELNGLIKKLYEGNASGKIPDKHFERMLAEYDEEQTSLEEKIAELQHEIDSFNEKKLRADNFMELVKRYTEFNELTPQMLNEFIEKVIIHEKVKDELGAKQQQIDIYLNFVGNFTLPEEILTAEELTVRYKHALRLAYQRERNRLSREKRKQQSNTEKLAQ